MKLREKKQVPFEIISEDYRAVKRDIKIKVSTMTLQYLNRKGVCKFPFYSFYKEIPERPEDRINHTEKNVIEHINRKFIEHYERI
jgi:hypothetical protein